MRIGQNPLKQATIEPLKKVVVLVITHLPEMGSQYHKNRLGVVKKSLSTLIANNMYDDHSLFIWDNGSCKALTQCLYYDYEPERLILSRNIGKTNALKSVMRMLRPGTILAYGDDDIEYFPNWLQPQIDILETFPNAGTVTGWPTRLESRWGEESTKKWAQDYKVDRFIPEKWEKDYCDSLGRDWPTHQLNTKNDKDFRINYKGVQAYATSHHCQFVCYPERVEPLVPWTDRAMANERDFDMAVDNAGLLRLATVERYTRHIGNKL